MKPYLLVHFQRIFPLKISFTQVSLLNLYILDKCGYSSNTIYLEPLPVLL